MRLPFKKTDKNERGAVLLTTLLLMTVMAALAVAIMDDIRFSVKRAIGVQISEQMDWYMRGAESFAGNWLQTNAIDNQAILSQVILSREPIVFPLSESAEDGQADNMLSITVADARNCYNINELANPDAKKQVRIGFVKLLELYEFDNLEASAFAARIQDWVDADSIPGQGGAEDLTYTNISPPYHAANTLMVDITELRAVEGVDEDIYQRMKLFLCAHSSTDKSRLNLNTLTGDDWPLLANVFDQPDEGVKAAQAVIALRPATGYENVDMVWSLPIVKRLELKGAGKNMVAVKTDLVNMDIQVSMGVNGANQVRRQSVRFELGAEGGASLVSRRSVH